MINKKKIQDSLQYCQSEVEINGDYDECYYDSDITSKNIMQQAKQNLLNCLQGFELLDINLSDSALIDQEKEIVNYIENEL